MADMDRLGHRSLDARRHRRGARDRGGVVHQPVDARDVSRGAREPRRVVLFPGAGRDRRSAVGFCSFWRVLDELHINNLAVLPELRRHGRRLGAAGTFVLEEGVELGAQPRDARSPALERRGAAACTSASASRLPACGAAYYTKPVEDALVLWREGSEPSRSTILKPCPEAVVVRSRPMSDRRRSYECRAARSARTELLRTDEEFHDLAAKHHQLEDRLHELTAKHYLSEPEQVEEVTLKKQKLQLKDRMEDILRRHRQEHAHG